MHPAIRILTLLVFAAIIPWLSSPVLVAIAVLLLILGASRPGTGRVMWRGIRRIRWLLLSLFVLYLWFSPGEPLFPSLAHLSPSLAGAELALRQVAVLLVMVCSATGLLSGIPPHELGEALRLLLTWPVPTAAGARFADRVGLLLAALPQVERQVRTSLRGEGSLADRAAGLFLDIEADAVRRSLGPAAEPLAGVPRWQWLLPPALLAGAMLLSHLPLPG